MEQAAGLLEDPGPQELQHLRDQLQVVLAALAEGEQDLQQVLVEQAAIWVLPAIAVQLGVAHIH